ncbi:MAG: molecular chaperone DnaK, partial [Crocinitomicaceae bacterium]|nr:molecular chaperone DnaK [Crocinitomicaceae bacterium]
EDKKEAIELALAELKTAHEAKDFATIDTAMEKLNTVFQAASQEMYAQDGAEGSADAGAEGGDETDDVGAEDVDFEEVKED